MPFTADAEIARIAHGVRARTLPKPEWTHAAHIAFALHIIHTVGESTAAATIPTLIRAYNEATNTPNTETSGYHETITMASLRAAAAFHAAHARDPLFYICNALLETPLGRADWLLAYYTPARLFSPEARRAWLPPDRAPLPPPHPRAIRPAALQPRTTR